MADTTFLAGEMEGAILNRSPRVPPGNRTGRLRNGSGEKSGADIGYGLGFDGEGSLDGCWTRGGSAVEVGATAAGTAATGGTRFALGACQAERGAGEGGGLVIFVVIAKTRRVRRSSRPTPGAGAGEKASNQ
jgi:hypothetical protein